MKTFAVNLAAAAKLTLAVVLLTAAVLIRELAGFCHKTVANLRYCAQVLRPDKFPPADSRDDEIAGVCFDSDGEYVEVNLRIPGVAKWQARREAMAAALQLAERVGLKELVEYPSAPDSTNGNHLVATRGG